MSDPSTSAHGSAHPQYVAGGGCSSTMPGSPKTWCNGKANHGHRHFALRLEPGGRERRIYWIGRVIQADPGWRWLPSPEQLLRYIIKGEPFAESGPPPPRSDGESSSTTGPGSSSSRQGDGDSANADTPTQTGEVSGPDPRRPPATSPSARDASRADGEEVHPPAQRLGVNEHGTPVSIHVCTACGDEFTVCPASTDGRFGDECLAPLCPSYDIDRDVDYLLAAGQRIVRDERGPHDPGEPAGPSGE